MLLAWAAAPSRAEPVALTFDDLPTLSLTEDPGYAVTTTRRLVADLGRCRAPAIGFVVGEKFEDRPEVRARLLRTWRRAGLALGNHTYTHPSLNDLSTTAYVADIARDDHLLRGLGVVGGTGRLWFRHPFLETGSTAEARRTVDDWLAGHGYRVAPVTLEADDDLFAAPYDEAVLARDRAGAAAIRRAYLQFVAARIAWYREAARDLLRRRPALIFLMHASRLNADAMPQVCAQLRARGLEPVSLARALRDPAYRLPDGPPDRDGDDWLNRWAGVLGRDLPWDSFPEAPPQIRGAAARLDPDTH